MIQVSNEVVENAKQCLEILNDDFELDMNFFNSYGEEYFTEGEDGFDFHKYSKDKVKDHGIWSFFYDGSWCNDKEYAKERMRFVIDNKAVPVMYNCEFIGFPWHKLEEQ